VNFSTELNITKRNLQSGFSMIEVLVTMLIISLAIMGTTGMQAYAMRMGQSSQFRTQAVFLAADLAERMEANKLAALANAYELQRSSSPPSPSVACSTGGACNGTALATYDLVQWQNAVFSALPQSSWQVSRATNANNVVYTITIRWVDRRTNTQYSSTDSGEALSYTAIRTFSN
jgi:type IV pilus assembly protein PilV